MNKQIINTDKAPAAIGPYNQAIVANGFLFISGQIALDPASGQLIQGSVQDETHRVMKNLDAILQSAGASFTNVVKTTIFLKSMDDFAQVNEVYASYFTSHFPARETVEVSKLPRNVNVEISMIAAV
jgi:2-iminobutanoate/2-iminopropanoate deaminase